jgi:hypothetical protein
VTRRWLFFAAAVLLAVTGIHATAGFETAHAERSVEVAVVSDDVAYLGVEQQLRDRSAGRVTLTVTVHNQFRWTTLDRVVVKVGSTEVDLTASGPLAPGDRRSTTHRVACDSHVVIEASGADVRIRLVRSVGCE